MKRSLKIFSVLLLLIFITRQAAAADDFEFEKKKTFTQTYSLSGNKEVSLKNSFGRIVIHSWRRDEVKVDVTITAKSNQEAKTQDILDGIRILSNDGATISFETQINSNNNNNYTSSGNKKEYRNSSSSMEINYEVYLPETTSLKIANKFGPVLVPDWRGELHIDESFGDLTTGIISKNKGITVKFGKLLSKKIIDPDLTVEFSTVKIDALSGDVKATLKFCKNSEIGFDRNTRDVQLNTSYTNMILNIPANLNTTLSIRNSFSDLKNRSSINIQDITKETRYGPTFTRSFTSTMGNGGSSFSIKSSYSNIEIR